ncbi:conjugal transfer protein TraF [Desulfosarcina cetonica]|uniref:conjugal transfer protein TraF n=1 Tax=Desulfosarcina cetonica TaxID=90730 RepID=UPI0009FA1BA7|nr:conjugal transfer protein TraF [Desulfosarcina cetonica]
MTHDTSGLNRSATSRRCFLLFFSLLLIAAPAWAADTFWEDRQRGYFWYEDPDLPVYEQQDVPVEDKPMIGNTGQDARPDQYTYDELFELHPDRFQVVIDARLKHAVHRPTEENVLRFLEATDVAKKKSRLMANVAGYVAMQNPWLTGESRYPYSQPGRGVYVQQRNKDIQTTLAEFKERYAIIAFHQAGCGYCTAQEEILDHFEHLNSWTVRRIDITENPGLAAKFHVEITPTLLLVSRSTQQSRILSSGVISLDQLTTRVYQLIRLMERRADPTAFYPMAFHEAVK